MPLVADTSLSGLRVARELDRIIEERGKPRMIVSDNGGEFTSSAILQWTDRSKVDWHYIAPVRHWGGTANDRRKTLWRLVP